MTAAGTSFGAYRIESLIGRGGMGVVYRAFDTSLERPVALKLIAPDLAGDERFRRRFLREPRLAAALDHPNVIPIYEAGERDGQLYLAMRYVDGSDLRKLLADGTLAPERALHILAQVAGALDAAHRRRLVHRDVKPANVLLDADEHAYLTDFGVSKRVGGETTDTGQQVGTLDYLAPEQIRGEPLDGRSDQYALACMLYECLAGWPPFRRETQAETLWAHLHDDPPPVAPALDRVLRRGLAKTKDDRYPTCAELIAAARAPDARAPRVRQRRRAVLAIVAGALVVAAAATAAFTAGGGGSHAPKGSGVAALDAAHGRLTTVVESAPAPSNLAVGAGAVWALDTQDAIVRRIDPRTKAVTGRFPARSLPSAVAAGAGAVWIGNGGGPGGNTMVSVSRVDPVSLRITRTVTLPNPGRGEGLLSAGFPQLAVGDGAVWAIDPDGTVARIDPRSGRVVARVPAQAQTVAAGREGVWTLADNRVARIDPATNRLGKSIPIGASRTVGLAVGAGSVWVTADGDGELWRIEPGPHPFARTIDVGPGAGYVAYGAGAVWVGNFIAETISRVDPRTNTVTARAPIGAAQGLAAGAGAAWVSTAGAPATGTLPASACGASEAGGRAPDVLIASDLPLQGPQSAGPRAMTDAIRTVLQQHGYRAGRFTVGYQSCDESTAQTGAFDVRRCAANANAYAHAKRLVAVIGPWSSFCAEVQLATLNRAPGGPVPVIGATTTYAGLTRPDGLPPGIGGGYRGEPGVYYPTGVRNFVRLVAGDDRQGAALAVLAKRLHLARVYVLQDGSDFWKGLLTGPFKRAAEALGVAIAGESEFDPHASGDAALARAVARSGADGVVVGAQWDQGGDVLVKALRARLGPRLPIMAGFGFDPPLGTAARGVYVATGDVPRGALPLTPAARAFAREAGARETPLTGVLEAAQAAELVLGAIARSDGTRGSVLERLHASRVRDGILGSFRFDRNGDIDPGTVPIVRIRSTAPDAPVPGAVVDRVVTIPARVLGP
jgi:Protein kinase domain